MSLADPGLGQPPPSFLLSSPFRVSGGVKMGAAGLPLPPPPTAPPAGAKISFLCLAGAFSGFA